MSQNGINYTVQGEGPPVILVHGMAASLDGWFYQVPDLVAAGYRVYALDLPGHGESVKPGNPDEYHIEKIYARFEAWLTALNLDTPALLISHSMGGYLSLTYALRHPKAVAALVLADPFYSKKQLFPLMRLTVRQPALTARVFQSTPGWALRSLITWVKNFTVDHPPEVLRQTFLDFRRASPQILFTAPTVRDLTPDLGGVVAPTLVIWGQHDLTLSPTSFPLLVASLPTATGRALPHCGHTPHLTRPDQFNHLTLEFLAACR